VEKSALDKYWECITFIEGDAWRPRFAASARTGPVESFEDGKSVPFGESHWKKKAPGVQFADADMHDAAVALMHVPGKNLTYCEAVKEVFRRRAASG